MADKQGAHDIPSAIVPGTIATTVVSMLSPTVVFGIVPTPTLATATALGARP